MAERTAVAIRHVAFEDLGTFGPALEAAGFAIRYLEADFAAFTGPDRTACEMADLLVILGGPIGVYETDRYPWLTDEIALVRQRLMAERPTIGICLGAQIMAAALGAAVYPGPAKEIGWAPITLTSTGTPAGERSPLTHLTACDYQVLHWHGDTFDLPEGAMLLASTTVTPNQAFSLGDYGLALQFHIEAPANLEPWFIGHTMELAAAGLDLGPLRTDAARHGPALRPAAERVLRDYLIRAGLGSTQRDPQTARV